MCMCVFCFFLLFSGLGRSFGKVLAGVCARHWQGHYVVPLRYLAVHPEERGPSLAEDRVRARLRGGRGRAQDEQEPGERDRPPCHLRPVSCVCFIRVDIFVDTFVCFRYVWPFCCLPPPPLPVVRP